MEQDGARYFGPFTNSSAVYQTLDMLRKVFPYLTCDRDITGKDKRACLYYDIKLCSAPCIGAATREEYRATMTSCALLEADERSSRPAAKMEATQAMRERAAIATSSRPSDIIERQRLSTRRSIRT
jgi:excinuclease ABC subunit C